MSDIGTWLEHHGLGKYSEVFRANELTVDVLPELTEDDLRELGLPMGPRKHLLKLARQLDAAAAFDQSESASHESNHDVELGEAERRQLTVMFCDLVGSVELGERMEVEDYRDFLNRFRAAVVGAIERHDGFIARHQGDGVLLYFGFPKAREDDAERAVRAGLEVVRTVDELAHPYDADARVRVGVATGPAVVGDVLATGASQRSELAALGPTPNLAARLQGAATPGSLVISATTRQLIAGLFELEALPPRTLKGIPEEVTSYRVHSENRGESRFMARTGPHLTPFVGREEELDLLERRWSRAVAGQGQVVLIVGEAGIGKSRLLEQLRRQIPLESHEQTRLQCYTYYEASALHPLITGFEKVLGFSRIPHPSDRSIALGRHLEAIGENAPEKVHLLSILLSLPVREPTQSVEVMDAQQRRERTLQVLVDYLRTRAERRPALFLVEDVQWADPSTLELLGRLVDALEGMRMLLVLTSRPGFDAPWTDFSHASVLRLSRLGSQAGRRLASVVAAASSEVAPDVISEVLIRAGGNPLFIEELTRAVVHPAGHGRTESNIPATLQDSLTARLDASSFGKDVAQCASVIGRVFERALLNNVWAGSPERLEEGLQALEGAGVVSRFGEGEHVRYEFRHALLRDAAYEMLLRDQRASLHARAAVAIEAHQPDTSRKRPELLARHYTEAGNTTAAVGLWIDAARHALERSAHAETMSHGENALALVEKLPESEERLLAELDALLAVGPALMNAKGSASADVAATYDRARQLAALVGTREQQFTADWGWWLHLQVSGGFDEARRVSEDVVTIGRGLKDSIYLLQGHHAAWTTMNYLGEHQHTLEHATEGIGLYNASLHRRASANYGDHDAGVCARVHLAYARWPLGQMDRAVTAADEAIALARSIDHPLSLAFAQLSAGMIHLLRRDPDAVRDHALELSANCAAHGLSTWQQNADILLGWADGALGRYGGVDRMAAAIKTRAATRARMRQALYVTAYAELLSTKGNVEGGLRAISDAVHLLDDAGEMRWKPLVDRIHGELLAAQGNRDVAEKRLLHSIQVARRQHALSFELAGTLSLARLWRDDGRDEEARGLLAPLYQKFTEGHSTKLLCETLEFLEV